MIAGCKLEQSDKKKKGNKIYFYVHINIYVYIYENQTIMNM